MMRALYTAATGMRAEQTNVDTIAYNLSNVRSRLSSSLLFARYLFRHSLSIRITPLAVFPSDIL